MKTFFIILRRELRALALLPQTYAIAAAYVVISGVFFVNLLVSSQVPDLKQYYSNVASTLIVLVPIVLSNAPHAVGLRLPVALQKQIELMVFGGLILLFLIVEPHGLARLWQITKEKLRLWPFPH